ncbi:MFS transporter [bacterium]|nr:MFS transporter [bacterium]
MFISIYIAAFIMDFLNTSISVALSMFLHEVKGSSPLIIGVAGFVAGFSYTATTFLKARFFSQKKTNWFIFIPAIAGLIYWSIYYLSVPLIFFMLVLAGLFYGIFWPSIQYCFSSKEGEKRLGFFNISWSAGTIFGSFLVGILYALNKKAPFKAALILGLIGMLGLYFKRHRITKPTVIQNDFSDYLKAPLEKIIEIRLLSFLHLTSVGAIMFLFPKIGLERNFSPQLIGIMFGSLLLFRCLAFGVLTKKSLVLHKHSFLYSCVLFSLGTIMVGLSPYPAIVFLGMFIIGITGAFSYHNSIVLHIKHNLPTEIHEGIIGAGLFIGPLLAGFLGHILNMLISFVIMSIMVLLTGLIYIALKPKQPQIS